MPQTRDGEEPCTATRVDCHGWMASPPYSWERVMLYWALIFLLAALVAGLLGFGGVASTSLGIAQILFFVFLVMFVVSLIVNVLRR